MERRQIKAVEIIKGDNETISTLMIRCTTSHKILRMHKFMPRVMPQTDIASLPIEPQFFPFPPSSSQFLPAGTGLCGYQELFWGSVLTCGLLSPEMQLQVEVFDHIAQLVVIRVFPELWGGGVRSCAGTGTARQCPPVLAPSLSPH